MLAVSSGFVARALNLKDSIVLSRAPEEVSTSCFQAQTPSRPGDAASITNTNRSPGRRDLMFKTFRSWTSVDTTITFAPESSRINSISGSSSVG